MTVEELRIELGKTIAGLIATGLDNIDSVMMEKIKTLSDAAGQLGMNEGKRLIENLSSTINSIKEGKSKIESGEIRLTALEFYLNNLSGSENIEEL